MNSGNLERFKIKKQIYLNMFFRGGSILLSFFIVSISVGALGEEDYGLWITIFSFVSWFSLLDFGLGNGLRNKIAKVNRFNRVKVVKGYISTSYALMLLITFFLSALFILISMCVDWGGVFETNNPNIYFVVVLTFSTFTLTLALKLVTSVSYAYHKSYWASGVQALNQLFLLITLLYVLNISDGALPLSMYASLVNSSLLFSYILATLVFFYFYFPCLRPSLKSVNFRLCEGVVGLGGLFFLVQINAVLLYSTDSFIINKYVGSDYVTHYSLIVKYLSVLTILLTVLISPFWSAIASLCANRDKSGVAILVNKISVILALILITSAFLYFAKDFVFKFWISSEYELDQALFNIVYVFIVIQLILQSIAVIINGFGVVKEQVIISTFAAVSNIPLSIYLAIDLGMGVDGVVLASVIVNTPALFIYPCLIYFSFKKIGF